MTVSLARSSTATPTHASTTVVLVTMCLGVFLAQLDSSVVYLGLKHIGDDLRADVNELQWVLDAYNLAYATFLLTGGTLGDLYGRLRIFLWGLAMIVAGSLICAMATNGTVLIAGRALTGLGSALEIPSSLAILAVTFTDAAARGNAGFGPTSKGVFRSWAVMSAIR